MSELVEETFPVTLAGVPNVAITGLTAPETAQPNTEVTITVSWKNNGDLGDIKINIAEKQPDGTYKFLKGQLFRSQPSGATGTASINLTTPTTEGVWSLSARAGYKDPVSLKFVRTDRKDFSITISAAAPPTREKIQFPILIDRPAPIFAFLLERQTIIIEESLVAKFFAPRPTTAE